MQEQMELAIAKEKMTVQSVYDALRPHINAILDKFNFSPRHITSSEIAEGLSIKYSIKESIFAAPKNDSDNEIAEEPGTRLIFQLIQKKNSLRIVIPNTRVKFYESDRLPLVPTKAQSPKERKIDITSDRLPALAEAICNDIADYFLTYPGDFGCCSLNEKCSNAGRCLQPNQDMAASCYYKKNLMRGNIFYGVGVQEEQNDKTRRRMETL